MTTEESSNSIYSDILEKINEAKALGQKTTMYIVDITIYDVKKAVDAYHKLASEDYSIHTSHNFGMHIVDITWN